MAAARSYLLLALVSAVAILVVFLLQQGGERSPLLHVFAVSRGVDQTAALKRALARVSSLEVRRDLQPRNQQALSQHGIRHFAAYLTSHAIPSIPTNSVNL